MIDIVLLLILCLFLANMLRNVIGVNFSNFSSKKNVKIINTQNLEISIIPDDDILKNIDQIKLSNIMSELITTVWQAFSSKDLKSVEDITSDQVKVNMEKKLELYNIVPKMLDLSDKNIASFHRRDGAVKLEMIFRCRVQNGSNILDKSDKWNISYKHVVNDTEDVKDDFWNWRNWQVDYTSAF